MPITSNRELHGFNDLWLRLIGIPVMSVVMPAVFFKIDLFKDVDYSLQQIAMSAFFITIYWHIDRYLVSYFRYRYPAYNQVTRRITIQLSVITGVTLTMCVISHLLMANFTPELLHDKGEGVIYSSSLFVTYLILGIYESIYFIARWRESIVESEKLKKANIHSQLETLKSQVNPHFLFNSLNTLSSLIPEDPELAVEFVQKLSKVYRYILEIKNKELIPLKEELECIAAYNFLLETRFGNNFKVNTDIPNEAKNKYIIPLALQLLIENAIKHNVVSTAKPLTIDIKMGKDQQLIVRNNLQLKKQVESSTKTGLDNIKSRYQILSGKEVDVIVANDAFAVSLPLLDIQNHAGTNH
jgi:two-component system LytT family sensor kinase